MLSLLLTALLIKNLKDVGCNPIRESNSVLHHDWLTKAWNYMKTNPETLEELMTKRYPMLEGDMILPHDRNAVQSTWPTLEIPYAISPELASRTEDVLSALAMVAENTCVSFRRRTTETDYLLFKISKGCASYVGFIGGEQPLFVGPQCIVGNIAHEVLHSLGFHHEHTRMDREQYITVLSQNIMPGMERNFKTQDGDTFNLPYDITSIMHYGSGFFSSNGLPTIVPRKETNDMGQRVKLTKTDAQRVRHLYSCDSPKSQTEKESKHVKNEDSDAPKWSHKVFFDSGSKGNQTQSPAAVSRAQSLPAEGATAPDNTEL